MTTEKINVKLQMKGDGLPAPYDFTTETPVGASIVLSVPLPPVSLRANSRAHWSRKKKDADEYSNAVYDAWNWGEGSLKRDYSGRTPVGVIAEDVIRWLDTPMPEDSCPWEKADVEFVWKYCGVAPDHSNLGGNTKYLLDIICVAPNLGPKQAAKYSRWHLGLIENDRNVTATYRMERVAHKADTGVLIHITEIKGDG